MTDVLARSARQRRVGARPDPAAADAHARQMCAAGSDKNVHAFVVDLGTVIDAKQDELDFGVTLLEGWDHGVRKPLQLVQMLRIIREFCRTTVRRMACELEATLAAARLKR